MVQGLLRSRSGTEKQESLGHRVKQLANRTWSNPGLPLLLGRNAACGGNNARELFFADGVRNCRT